MRRDGMADRDMATALGQRQRLDLMCDMVGGLSHELNNALCVAGGRAELLVERLSAGEADMPSSVTEIRKVADWVQRAAVVSAQLEDFSRTLRQVGGRVDMSRLARSAAELQLKGGG